jgi:hypothetical protein
LALEVQRGSIPGAPNAIEFSGGFIGGFHSGVSDLWGKLAALPARGSIAPITMMSLKSMRKGFRF